VAQRISFFPGILRHHSIKLKASYQKEDVGDYHFNDLITVPRGYTYYTIPQFFTSSIDYALPLFYPDLSLPGFTYIKRLKADVFADYAHAEWFFKDPDFLSTGIEITADLHLLRFYAPIEMGFRSIYVTNTGDLKFEFLWSIGLGTYGGKEELRMFAN